MKDHQLTDSMLTEVVEMKTVSQREKD